MPGPGLHTPHGRVGRDLPGSYPPRFDFILPSKGRLDNLCLEAVEALRQRVASHGEVVEPPLGRITYLIPCKATTDQLRADCVV